MAYGGQSLECGRKQLHMQNYGLADLRGSADDDADPAFADINAEAVGNQQRSRCRVTIQGDGNTQEMPRVAPLIDILDPSCKFQIRSLHLDLVLPRRAGWSKAVARRMKPMKPYDGSFAPQADAVCRLARITSNNSLLSAGF